MTKQSKIISYFKLPEMRIFWIILVPLLALTIVNFYFVHSFWGIVTLIISISVSLIVFFVSLKSAKTRFDLVTERNQIKLIIANFTDRGL